MITLNKITKEFDSRLIFKELQLEILEGDRLGIVGLNGSGKTTLMNILAGEIEPDGGKVLRPDYISVQYMEQVDESSKNLTLSGGELTKVRIQKAFDEYSQVLLLDEPTNHLDFKGILWLKKLIDEYYGTVVIISHDRYFLDLVCTSIYEIENQKGTKFQGNYSDYKKEKQHRRKTQELAYERQEKTKSKIQNDIKNLRQWSDKAHRDSTKKALAHGNKMGVKEHFRSKAKKKDAAIKSRIKRLEKVDLEGVDKPEEELKIKFAFNKDNRNIAKMIVCEEVSKAYEKKTLFENVNISISKGERIGLLGLNGTGKTTFIKMILGDVVPDSGSIRVNQNMSIGYLSQEVLDLDEEKTIMESLGFDNKSEQTIARIQLNNLGIHKGMIRQKIKTLSMGERTRVKLAKIILSAYDILILDEPTNHLDIVTRETLENALVDYQGTLIIVSHDYYMMEKLCDDTLVLEHHRMERTYASPKDYLDQFLSRSFRITEVNR